ncbi:hypothetical protein OAT73_06615 [Candidatus Poseidoniaceae archaeon]|nr:hypothetical protein [Candidatus Poseidoniaceae archaeon]
MDSVNVWNMDVSEGMAIMASNYSIIYKGSQWAMHKGTVRMTIHTKGPPSYLQGKNRSTQI